MMAVEWHPHRFVLLCEGCKSLSKGVCSVERTVLDNIKQRLVLYPNLLIFIQFTHTLHNNTFCGVILFNVPPSVLVHMKMRVAIFCYGDGGSMLSDNLWCCSAISLQFLWRIYARLCRLSVFRIPLTVKLILGYLSI